MTATFWFLILKRNLFGSGRVRFCGLEEVPIFGQGRFPKEASALLLWTPPQRRMSWCAGSCAREEWPMCYAPRLFRGFNSSGC